MSSFTRYAILNTDLNRFLTSGSGNGIWDTKADASEVMENEFGGGDHLEVVSVLQLDKRD